MLIDVELFIINETHPLFVSICFCMYVNVWHVWTLTRLWCCAAPLWWPPAASSTALLDLSRSPAHPPGSTWRRSPSPSPSLSAPVTDVWPRTDMEKRHEGL